MTKTFEDEFMEWQADMVDIAKEFIEDRAEKFTYMVLLKMGGIPLIYSFKSMVEL